MSVMLLPHHLAELAAFVLLLGVKHGFDADHLAMIDSLTRAGADNRARSARGCGALFSLGHGGVVVIVAVTISHATSVWHFPRWLGDFGAWLSIGFLLVLGMMNVINVCRTAADEVVAARGLRQLLLGRVFGAGWAGGVHPLWSLAIGALFAISLDTLSEAALFSAAASRTGVSQGALVCGLFFTTGMLLTDGLNGWWVSRLLSRSSAAARTASRVMGLSVGAASLLMAAVGVVRQSSGTASAWLNAHGLMPSLAVILVVACAFLISLRMATGGRARTAGGTRVEPSRAVVAASRRG